MDVQDAERNAGLAQFVLEMDELPREYVEAIDVLRKVARAFPKMLEALEAARRELHCPHANDGAEMAPGTFQYGHRCVLCDESVDRNSEVRDALDSAIRAAREAVKP